MKKKLKKIGSVFLSLMLCLQLIPAITLTASAEDGTTWDESTYAFSTDGSAGTTADNPIIIDTAGKLAYLATQVNTGTDYTGTYFKLTADLNLDSKEWTPIGTAAYPFRGTFDGGDHTISNLSIPSTTIQYVGLFGYVNNIEITNLNVSGTISASSADGCYVGGIIGYCTGEGLLANCSAAVTINASCTAMSKDVYAGSICGAFDGCSGAEINNCCGAGTVTITNTDYTLGNAYIGGFIGFALGANGNAMTIINCSSSAAVTAISKSGDISAGGFVHRTGYCNIYNCYATGAVTCTGTDYADSTLFAGGFLGYSDNGTKSSIHNCYSTGTVTGTTATGNSSCIGGFYGSADCTLTNNYWLASAATSGTGDSTAPTGLISLTSAQMTGTGAIGGEGDYVDKTLLEALNAEAEVITTDIDSSAFAWKIVSGINNDYPILIAPIKTYSNFLITKSSPTDSTTETSYYYVYAGDAEASLSAFTGDNADADGYYSNFTKLITDVSASVDTSATLYFAKTGNTVANATGTLEYKDNINLSSGEYTFQGALKSSDYTDMYAMCLNGASVIIDGDLESIGFGIENSGSGDVTVKSGTISVLAQAIDSTGSGNIIINGGTITSTTKNAISVEGTGDCTVNSGTITTAGKTAIACSATKSHNLTINGGTISSTGTLGDESIGISFESTSTTCKLTITGGKIYSSDGRAVVVNGTATISGDLWDESTQSGTLIASSSTSMECTCLKINDNANVAISGGTILTPGVCIDSSGTLTISGGLIKSTSATMPAIIAAGQTTITGGTITGACTYTAFDMTDINNLKYPGTILFVPFSETTALRISGGTITNIASTGYALYYMTSLVGYTGYVYLSGTPSLAGGTATVWEDAAIYANDGSSKYYTGSPVPVYYGGTITKGSTVIVSNVSDGTNANLFFIVNKSYELSLSKTDLIAKASSAASLTSILSKSISVGSEAGSSAAPKTASISVANSVSAVAATDVTGATDSTVVFYGKDNTFTTAEAGSVSLTAGSSTTVYIKVTAADATTVLHYAVTISRAAAVSSNSNFLITKSSPTDSATETSYYYVYAGNAEASLSAFSGDNADVGGYYSSFTNLITDVSASADTSATLYFAKTGNTVATALGTLDTDGNSIALSSGTYTIKGAITSTSIASDSGLITLTGASVIIDGATIDSSKYGIYNTGTGSITVSSGTITTSTGIGIYNTNSGGITVSDGTITSTDSSGYGIRNSGSGSITVSGGTVSAIANAIVSDSSGSVTVNGGTISATGTTGAAISVSKTGSLTITGGKISSSRLAIAFGSTSGSFLVTGSEWNDTTQTGTLISGTTNITSAASAEIKGGTFLSTSDVPVSITTDVTISGGAITANSSSNPAIVIVQGTTKITSGTITSGNTLTSPSASSGPGVILLAASSSNTALYISGGTITNTASTGYVIYNTSAIGYAPSLYLSGTPSLTGGTATVWEDAAIYANDGSSTYYTGSSVSVYYGGTITKGSTVIVSNVSNGTNANKFLIANEGYALSLSKTDLIITASNGAELTSLLSQSITAGSEAGTSSAPKTASINVANSVSAVTASDIAGAANATVTFYGTDSTFTTAEAGSVSLTAGSSKTVYIKVTAQDNVTVGYYAVAITRAAAQTPPAPYGGGSESGDDNRAEVIVNGESYTAGTVDTTTNDNGKTTTTITVNEDRLSEILEKEGNGAEVIVAVPEGANTAKGVLNGQMVSDMENQSATLVVQTENSSYTLPAEEIDINAVSEQFGKNITLSDIKVAITISEPDNTTVGVVAAAAEDGGFSLVVPAVEYTVECTYNGKTVKVDTFNSYVKRTIAIPDGVDPSKITTGIVVSPDGTTRHVPTEILIIDGKYYAIINSLTNSTYAVVWHPYEFSDVTNHWAKDSINNMGSRMVVSGVGEDTYEPDRNMTRAEFAAIIVKALGLAPGEGSTTFSDVSTGDWYNGYVKTAAEYGIITGYPDGSFGPMDAITREQAMTMIARAMSITKLDANLASGETTTLLDNYSDRGTISEYAIKSVAQCVKAGMVSGRTSTTIAPAENITRAEVAVIVERLLKASDLID